jgi:hypothetical protein
MSAPSRRSVPLIAFGLVASLWVALTIVALVGSITGGNPLYVGSPGGLVLPNLSLLGRAYLISSIAMPFFLIGAIASA